MKKSARDQRGQARVKLPVRNQIKMLSLEQWLDPQHRVRVVWRYVESLDLSELYEPIKAVDGHVGRHAIDPRMLFALWLFATLEGVTSARRLAELTTRDLPYMWLCGDVSVNHHRLSDFRVDHGDLLERILVDSIAVLLHQNLITLETVTQDGMRVRANAGSGTFRRGETLQHALAAAKAHVEKLQEEDDDEHSDDDRRRRGSRKRAAEESQQRIEQAIAELEILREQREKRRGTPTSEPRTSTTDPEARRMKMADGGHRPALNVQFAVAGDSRLVVGVEVTNQGTDNGLMAPMHAQLDEDYSVLPQDYLVDGGFAKASDVTHLEQAGTRVHAPLSGERRQLAAGRDPYAKKPGDTDEMAAFRARMGTDEAKTLYRQRAAIAEFPNADCRNRGLIQFRVRGLLKAKAQTLWHVLAFNFCRLRKLQFLEAVMAC